MRQFASFIKKEFYHITRDKRTMLILLLMPVVQLIIFGYAITTEINNTTFVVFDTSKGEASTKLIQKIDDNKYFNLVGNVNSLDEVERSFQKGESKIALIIPSTFENDLLRTGTADIQIMADASDPNTASIVNNYMQSIIMQFNQEQLKIDKIPYTIHAEVKMLYNPQMKSAYNFVPGIMGLILMLICAMMTSIAIVREKEQGTMEILLVSPMKSIYIVLSKAVPYLLISFIDVIMILIIANTMLAVPIVGNIFLILFLSITFILASLSLGLLISSVVETQQAAMFVAGGGLMLPTMLLSGLIFSIENMPLPLQIISNIVPARWFILAIKDVMIKGLGFAAIWQESLILLGMTVFLLTVSIKKFKNRL